MNKNSSGLDRHRVVVCTLAVAMASLAWWAAGTLGAQADPEEVHRWAYFFAAWVSLLALASGAWVLRLARDNLKTQGELAEARRQLDLALRPERETPEHAMRARSAELVQHEALFRQMLENAPVMLAHFGPDGCLSFANRRYAQALGYADPSEIVGKPYREILPRAVHQTATDLITQVQAGEPLRYELERSIHGEARILETTLAGLNGHDPRISGVFAVVSDVTERKQAEIKSGQRAQRLRQIMDLVPHLIFAKDREGRFLLVNQAFADFFGRAVKDLIGKTGAQAGLPSSQEADAADAEVRASATRLHFPEQTVAGADGRDHVFSALRMPFFHSDEHPDAVLGVATDLSELVQQKQALRQSEQRLRQLFDLAPMALTVKDGAGRFLLANAAGTTPLYQMEPARMIGKTLAELGVADAIVQAIAAADLQARRSGQMVELDEIGVVDAQGRRRWTVSRRVPFWYSEEQPDALLTVTVDVTSVKEAEEQARRLSAELEQRVQQRTAELTLANEGLEAFSYSVSHDLRAPLRAVRGFTRILSERDEPPLDDEASQLLERISAAGKRMDDMIDAMLGLAQSQRARMARVPLNLSVLARSIWEEITATASDRKVEFKVAQDMCAHGDAALVRGLLQNLLANAFKFTRRTAGAQVEFGSMEQGGDTVFLVRDNGAGFDMAYARKLFGVFQRLHGNKEFEGTGIGLATVQRIVQRHGGRVWAEAWPGAGATFFFTLQAPSGADSGCARSS